MRTILFSYEFGSGLGHLNRLVAIAKRLAGAHRLVFTIPNVALGEPVIRRALGDRVEILQGVNWRAPADPAVRKIPTQTFADVIRLFGFDQADRLQHMTGRWVDLLRTVSPDLIVADFAPALRLAAMDKIPTIVVGNGYTAPPAGAPLPPLRPWEVVVRPESRANEGRLLAAVNDVRSTFSGPAVHHFADLFHGDQTFVCTISEFDPYQSSRKSPVIWPFNIPEIASGRAVDQRHGAAVFCYLPDNHPALPRILEAIGRLGRRVEIYVQGTDPRAIAARSAQNVRVHPKPADFSAVLPETSVLVHHAGLGTAYAGLSAGTPQLVLPLNLEHMITTRGLQSFGVAVPVGLNPLPSSGDIHKLLEGLLSNPSRQEAALRAASEIRSRRVNDPAAPVVDACHRFL